MCRVACVQLAMMTWTTHGQQRSVSMPTLYQRHVVSLLASSSCHHHNLLAIVNLLLNNLLELNPVSEMRQGFRVEHVSLYNRPR